MIRHYCKIGDDDKKIEQAYYYDDAMITKYEGPEGGDLALAIKGDDGQPNPIPHGYLEVPFSERKMSEEGTNLFDSVIHLVDFFDRIISEGFANEEQRSASSYLLLADQLSGELDEMGLSEIDKLKITRTFENLGRERPVTDSVAFLTKNIPTDFLKLITDTFERLIYEQMQVLNPNAMVDTGEISGRAYKFRILMFEYLCADIQTYMSRGIQWGIRLIQNIDKSLSAKPQERPQVDIKWERNLPDDMAEAVDQFAKVSPTSLPIRTALGLFPDSFIPDREAVAREMEGEMAERAKELTMDSKVDDTPDEPAPDANKGE
jgi:SPP1 family phage portal protein